MYLLLQTDVCLWKTSGFPGKIVYKWLIFHIELLVYHSILFN